VEGHFGVAGLLPLLSRGVFAEERALRVYADPAAADALEDVGKYTLFINLTRADFVVEDICAIGDSGVAQHADGYDALLKVHCLVFAGDELGKLLVAGGDIAAGGDVDKKRGQDEFEAVLVAGIDGTGPGVFDLLEFLHLGAEVGSSCSRSGSCRGTGLIRRPSRGGTLSKNRAAGKQKNRKADGTTSHSET